ncbi:MAG: BadF/BadG/BcrA/BcrD ATPase family protein [Litoreibacter sp.]|uniref:BadF/BadG/BcrA/BcrD ATPase family protein n=1 Tax=Litoreibacter sp. TaxID=1969459 RepID=UPI0032969BCF
MYDLTKSLIIGVDGGGTGCRVAIGTRSDGILVRAVGGSANFATNPDCAIANVKKAVVEAAAKLDLDEQSLTAATAHVGLAGALTEDDQQRVANALPYKTITVTDDRPTSVVGALGAGNGYLLSVGTGTIAAANSSEGFRYVGGWGFHISDQASGAWLGRAALEQTMLCYDGLAKYSDVTRDLFAKFDNDPSKAVAFSMSAKPGDFGAFAPDVVRGAASGDPWALLIMDTGAKYLAASLAALGHQAGDSVCLTGGLGPLYTTYLPAECSANLIPASGNALDGAFRLASQTKHQQSRPVT